MGFLGVSVKREHLAKKGGEENCNELWCLRCVNATTTSMYIQIPLWIKLNARESQLVKVVGWSVKSARFEQSLSEYVRVSMSKSGL
jgi:hypothetical protein